MKRITLFIFSTILLVVGILSIIILAQLIIRENLGMPDFVSDAKGAYTGVAVLMGIAAGLGIILSIVNLVSWKGTMWTGINALGATVIGIIVMAFCAAYVVYLNNGTIPGTDVSMTTYKSVMYLPMFFSGIIFVPACIGFVLGFKEV